MKKLSDCYELLECGPIKANFQSGLICTHINTMTNALRINLQNVPNLESNELRDWLKKIIGIEWDQIKNHDFQTENINKTPPYYFSESTNGLETRRDTEKETWGRQLVIQTPSSVTVQDIINRYGADVIIKCLQLNKQNEKVRVESSLKLNNLPLKSDENFLRECLQSSNGPKPKYIHVGRTNNDVSGWAI